MITDHKSIAISYLKGWFWLDLLACFPFNYINFGGDGATEGAAGGGENQLLRLARLPRLYRLVRLLRMVKMLRIVKNLRFINDLIELFNVYPALMRLGRILSFVLYLVHLFACLWFFVANLYPEK